MQSDIFLSEILLSRKSSLKICQIYSNLANYQLGMIRGSVGSYSKCINGWKMRNKIASFKILSFKKVDWVGTRPSRCLWSSFSFIFLRNEAFCEKTLLCVSDLL